MRTIGTAAALATTIAAAAIGLAPVAVGVDKQQQIAWEQCPDGVTKPGAECGRIDVPLDYSQPDGATISVGFIRVKGANSHGAVFTNPGGPGGSAYSYVGADQPFTLPDSITSQWDMVGVQPRGLVGSTPIDCGQGESIDLASALFSNGAALRQACEASNPGYGPHITTENTARDWEEVRRALGYEKINILGLSYGTILGSVYATLFPQVTDKVVLDSGTSPTTFWSELMQAQEAGYTQAFHDFFAYVATRNDAYGLGTTPYAVYTSWARKVQQESGAWPTITPPKATMADLPAELAALGPAGLDAFNAAVPTQASSQGLSSQATTGGNQAASPTVQLTRQIAPIPREWDYLAAIVSGQEQAPNVDASTLSEATKKLISNSQLMQQVIMCNEGYSPTNPLLWPKYLWGVLVSNDPIATPSAAFGSGAVCAGAEPTTRVPALDGSQLATRPLELQGTGDPQTPYGLYHGMSDPMGSTVVTVHGPGHGHVGLGNDAAEALVAHYLLTGEVTTTDLPGLHT